MGVKITELIEGTEVNLEDLSGKVIAIDSYIYLYQFLTTIRQPDGALLRDSKGRITSHLSGLFFRTMNLLSHGMKLVFVFDGKVPQFKKKERDRRRDEKEKAKKQYEIAKEYGDIEMMKKYSQRTVSMTPEIIKEAKELISAMGQPIVQAPSEGEAQAAYMVKEGDAYAVSTQDIDSIMFGAPRIIKNLNLVGKQKKAKKYAYKTVKPEIITRSQVLEKLEIDSDQLIALSMLVGTDYNAGGIKGIGPKKALTLVKKYKEDFTTMFQEAEWDSFFDYPWNQVFTTIKEIPVTNEYSLEWNSLDQEKITTMLVEEHGFSKERIESMFEKLQGTKEKQNQSSLGDF
jgi:flap endonuclease-1